MGGTRNAELMWSAMNAAAICSGLWYLTSRSACKPKMNRTIAMSKSANTPAKSDASYHCAFDTFASAHKALASMR